MSIQVAWQASLEYEIDYARIKRHDKSCGGGFSKWEPLEADLEASVGQVFVEDKGKDLGFFYGLSSPSISLEKGSVSVLDSTVSSKPVAHLCEIDAETIIAPILDRMKGKGLCYR